MAIKKIAPNRYRVTVSVRDKNKGYPITKQKTVDGTRSQAVIAESDMLKELKARSLTSAYAVTFGDAIDLHVKHLRIAGRLSKRHEYQIVCVRKALGHIRLEVFANQYEQYIKHYTQTPTPRGTPPTGATINRHIAIVRAAFNRLVDLEVLDKNPITKMRFPRYEENPRDRYLTQEERLLLLSTIKQHRPFILPIIQYMMLVPCRTSELTTARREQYNPFTNTIYIPDSKAGIPIHKPVPPELEDYFKAIPEDCPWLFYKFDGGRYYSLESRLSTAWKFCVRKAGIDNIRKHDLRHMAATDLHEAGNPTHTIMDIAGWKTDMMKVYWKQDSLRSAQRVVFRSAPDDVAVLSEAV